MQRWMSLFSRKNWMVSHNLEIVLAFLARDRIPSSELFLNKFRVGYVGEEHRRVADASLRSRQEQLCYIKTFIQDLRVCECIENIDKIFVLRSFSPSSRSLFFSSFSHFARRVHRRSERMVPDGPSFRTNRRVSIVERSTRHASSRDACDVNEGRFFYYFVPLFVANPLSRIIDVLISLKFFFF